MRAPPALTAAWLLVGLPAWLSHAAAPVAAAPESAAQEVGPYELMTLLSTRLLATLDRDRSRIRQRPDLVMPLVDELLSPHFDTEQTARLVLGAHWRSATPAQRERFAAALYRTLLSTYAGAVAEWTSERLRILPLRGDLAASQATVRTEVARLGAAAVIVDYRLRRTAEGWKIFDVVVDGVSYVRSYHDDIDGEVSQNGLDASIARLETRSRSAARAADKVPGSP